MIITISVFTQKYYNEEGRKGKDDPEMGLRLGSYKDESRLKNNE